MLWSLALRFDSLSQPAEPQVCICSHVFEVQSGMLFQPAGNAKADLPHMEMLLNTYGKTWHTWQVDRGDKVPLGMPFHCLLPSACMLLLHSDHTSAM